MGTEIRLEDGGKLTMEVNGGFVRCEATRPNDGKGIYKVWLTGAGGKLLLGTLAPERGVLRLCRQVSRDSLVRAGCWPVEGGECVLAFPFVRGGGWVSRQLEGKMGDGVLRRAACGLTALVRGEGDGFAVALPFDTGRPFGLTPAFCFARVERVEGRLCTVFSFDRRGMPRINSGQTGENEDATQPPPAADKGGNKNARTDHQRADGAD